MSERRILVLSTAAALAMALLGLVLVVASQSRVILLDAVFNAVFFAAGLATLRIERLLREPDNARFPFGHAYFESLVNAGKGLLILGISVIALGDSLVALATGGRSSPSRRSSTRGWPSPSACSPLRCCAGARSAWTARWCVPTPTTGC